MSVKDVNRIPELVRQLKSFDNLKLRVGIFAPGGSKIFMVARVHEYGIDIPVTDKMRAWFLAQGMPLRKDTDRIRIPERSYLRTGWDKNEPAFQRKAAELMDRVLQGEISAYDAREELGEYIVQKIRENVDEVGLVKTGELRAAIDFAVVKR